MGTVAWIAVAAYVVAGWVVTGVFLALATPEDMQKYDFATAFCVAVFWLPMLIIMAAMMLTMVLVERWRKAGRGSTGTGAEGKG